MYKYLRLVKIRRIGKSLQLLKIRQMFKSLQPMKIRRIEKSLWLMKITQIGKSSRALKSPRPVKYWQSWKSRRNWKCRQPAYCLGLAESPTADVSLVPLMSKFCSSLMWWISHVVSQWREGSGCPDFMGRPSPVPYRLFVPARHAKKGSNPRCNQKSGFCLEFHWFLSNHNNS